MKKRSHIIGRQIFEIGFSSREKSHELQGRISSAFNGRVADEIGQLFDRIVPENKLISVDSLTIDIGNIPFDFFDDELARKITEQLEHELLLLLLHDNSGVGNNADGTSGNVIDSYLKLLEYFLLRGTLPWWAGGEDLVTPVQALEELLILAAVQLKTLITNIGQNDYVRARLVYQFPEQHLRSVISILEPADAQFIFEYHTQVVQKQQERELVKSEESEFNKGVWIFILTYLLVDRGTHFNRKQFVKSTLASMSAHFNVAFAELLALFAAALNAGGIFGNTDSLQSIILELAIENDRNIVNVPDEQTSEYTASAEKAEQYSEILRYYLTFGSLPWWSPNREQPELAAMFTELIKKFPQTTAAMIKSIGKQEHTRSVIVKTFSEEVVKQIISLIEPNNAEYIFDYVDEIRTVHAKQSALKAPVNEFNTAIWLFILEYLLVDRGSEFNRMMFLESNIRKLANRYNVKYHELLMFMVQSIAVAHHSSSRHVSLLQGLTALYKIADRQGTDGLLPTVTESTEVKKREEIVGNMSLKNILYFWVRFGYLPWWADKPSDVSPYVLLEQFIQSTPQEAVLFLKHAGLKANTRRRMVYQMPLALLLKLFRMLPEGNIAAGYFDELLNLIKGNTRLKFPEERIPGEILLLSMWSILDVSFYEKFDEEAFVRSAVADLAEWLQVSVERFFDSFKKISNSKEFGDLYQKLFGQLQSIRYERGSATDEAPDFDIKKLIASRLKKHNADAEEIAKEALTALKYFLKHGKLPDYYRLGSEYAVSLFLKQLLLLLLQEKSSSLEAILKSSDYPGQNLIRLHDLFTVTASISERNLNVILSDALEKDIRLFLEGKAAATSEKDFSELIGKYLREPTSASADIVRHLLRSRSASIRLAYYYKNDEIYKLIDNKWIEGWDTQAISGLKGFHSNLSVLISGNLDKDRFDLFFRAFIFMMIGGDLQIRTMADFLHYFFRFLYERDRQFLLRLSSSVNGKGDTIGINPEIEAELKQYSFYESRVVELEEQLSEADKKAMDEAAGSSEEERKILEKEKEEQEKEKKKKTEEKLDDPGTIYINNAGLVLLHPFIGTYFTRLGMIEKGDFISDDARHRAVHLLQYLVYGTEQHEEQELVLNKILCNMPVEEAIVPGIVITDIEKSVSAELLLAVLARWEKLKNTSPESLQTTFLQRKGGLLRNEENWNLKVEQKGYDILLQTLPWGLGMIKTPWMSEFIFVEWM